MKYWFCPSYGALTQTEDDVKCLAHPVYKHTISEFRKTLGVDPGKPEFGRHEYITIEEEAFNRLMIWRRAAVRSCFGPK